MSGGNPPKMVGSPWCNWSAAALVGCCPEWNFEPEMAMKCWTLFSLLFGILSFGSKAGWQTQCSMVRLNHHSFSSGQFMTLDSSKRLLPRRFNRLNHRRFKRWSYPFGPSSIKVTDGNNPKSRDELLHEILDNQHPIIGNEDIDVEDFLWTGEGQGSSQGSSEMDTAGSAFNPQFIQPTPVQNNLNGPSSSSITGDPHNYHPYGSKDLPEEQYLIRTILQSNMTIIHKGIEHFRNDMEQKLTRAYRAAYEKKRFKREMSTTTLQPEDETTTLMESLFENQSPEDTTILPDVTTPYQLTTTSTQPETTGISIGTEPESILPDTTTDEPETSTAIMNDADLELARNVGLLKSTFSSTNDDDSEALPTVRIHNIRSSLPRPEIEMIYTVNRDEALVNAVTAVEALCNLDDSEVAEVLGFPLVTKAEPYTVRAEPYIQRATSQTSWLIAAVVVSTCLAIIVLLALLLLLRHYKKEENKHKRLLASPGPSTSPDEHSQTGIHATMGISSPMGSVSTKRKERQGGEEEHNINKTNLTGPTTLLQYSSFLPTFQIDQAAFTLACPKEGVDVASGPSPANSTLKVAGEGGQFGGKYSSGEDIFRSRGNLDDNGGESPAQADQSSNNTPELQVKAKTRKTSRERKHSKSSKKPGRFASNEVEQSSFPIRTPDKEGFLGPLTDLLEEEIMLPGESRETSAESAGRNWAYLPQNRKSPTASTTSSTSSGEIQPHKNVSSPPSSKSWHQRKQRHKQHKQPSPSPSNSACSADPIVEVPLSRKLSSSTKEEETQHFQGSGEGATAMSSELPLPDSPDSKKRALSAKSHITRKGKIQSSTDKIAKNQTRPWSATESRLQADPVFNMRQRHWEDLISGKKKLHRGQLLPGSTSEEEVQYQLELRKRRQPQSCWSEGTSPKKQVSFCVEPPNVKDQTPDGSDEGKEESNPGGLIIQAIRDELQKFQRPKSPNLTGISIISDPNLLNKESDA
eukprot:TCALIF_09122-PA protein Name:"Protein of unknown function" AED:0.06 eAED:0.04 QI:0/0.6/0.33/0.83/0.8/0.66/6/74/974